MREGSVANLSGKIVLLTWSLFLFLALIPIINLLQITYYPVVHRANIESIIHIVLISDQLDSVLVMLFAASSSFFTFLAFQRLSGNKWLASSPLILLNLSALLAVLVDFDLALVLIAIGVSAYIILAAKALKKIIGLVEVVLVIICVLEAGSLVHWLLLPFMMPSWVTDLPSRLSAIEAQLFYTPADLTPIAMLILLFSYPLFTLVNRLRKSAKPKGDDTTPPQLDLRIDGRILLVVAILVTAFIASYPYLPSINPTGKYVGTDIYYYSQWLGEMEANPSRAIEFTIHHISQRPFFLLTLYYMKLFLQVPTIPFLEWIGVPIFCLLPISVYCFGLVINGRTFAGLAALLSSFSINVVVGMYTAYYSNVVALSLLYFALSLLILAIGRSSNQLLASSCTLSILAIFIHPWTWAFILIALCLYVGSRLFQISIISHKRVLPTVKRLAPILFYILVNIIVYLLKTLLMPVPIGMGFFDIASAKIGLKEFFNLGFNLYFTFRIFVGGYSNNFSAILTAIVGTWYFSQKNGLSRDITVAWLSMSAFPTLFVDFWVNERIFYNLPVQLLSTMGLWFCPSMLSSRRRMVKTLLLIFLLLNLNFALRSMANLI